MSTDSQAARAPGAVSPAAGDAAATHTPTPSSDAAASGQRAIWEHFQNEGRSSFDGSRTRLSWLAKRAARLAPGGSILDVGIGGGIFAEEAAALGLTVSCVDPDARAIGALRERLELGERARVGDAASLPFEDAGFDVVCMSEVLEHLPEDVLVAALAEVERVLKPGGTFLGTVPHAERLETQMVVCPHCEEHFHRWGHVRSFDLDGARALFSKRFERIEVEARPFPDFPTLNWKGKLRGVLRLGLARVGQVGEGASLVFLARRRG